MEVESVVKAIKTQMKRRKRLCTSRKTSSRMKQPLTLMLHIAIAAIRVFFLSQLKKLGY